MVRVLLGWICVCWKLGRGLSLEGTRVAGLLSHSFDVRRLCTRVRINAYVSENQWFTVYFAPLLSQKTHFLEECHRAIGIPVDRERNSVDRERMVQIEASKHRWKVEGTQYFALDDHGSLRALP